jgi:ketosteroid isomerase-like protein
MIAAPPERILRRVSREGKETLVFFFIYHFVVRTLLKRGFADLSAGKLDSVVRRFHRDATFRFSGDHALGGELHGREQIGAWFARLRRLFPDLTLTPLQIVAAGGPWLTTVATRFRVDATLPGGAAYTNEGMQYVRLRWAAIVEDRLYEDTERLCAALATIADEGVSEALAAPLSET